MVAIGRDLPMDFASFLVQCLNAVQYGLLLFLVASGLTLIFGIMGVINLAHGSFYMIGAYLAFSLAPVVRRRRSSTLARWAWCWRWSSAIVLEWAVRSRYLYERDHLQQVLMTYGLILVFEELRSMLVGNDVHGVPVPPWLAGGFRSATHAVSGVPAVRSRPRASWSPRCCTCVITRTRLGMMIRAGASNRDMVAVAGHRHQARSTAIVFAAGVALAALAGMIAAPVSSVYPGMGRSVLIICFVVVVIGGIGSISGALRRLAAGRLRRHLRQGVLRGGRGIGVYLLMAAILVWRPEGLLRRG